MDYLSSGGISTAKSNWSLLKRSAQNPIQLTITQWLYPHFKIGCKRILEGFVSSRIFFQHRKLLSVIFKAIYQLDTSQKFDHVVSSGDVPIGMLAVFWHHPHGLQQQLIASPTRDHQLTRRKTYGGWWLTSDEICLSITYFISQGYNGNLAQMPTFTWWSYRVRWNEFQAQGQAALLFAVSNPEGPLKAESYQPWQYGFIRATMTSSDGCVGLNILSTLSRPISSMAHPSLPFSHPWLLVPYISSGQSQSPLLIIFVTVLSYSCLPLRALGLSLLVVLTVVFLDVLFPMTPKSSQAMRRRISSLSSFTYMSFFPPETSVPPLSSPEIPSGFHTQCFSISKVLVLICSSSFHSVPDYVPFSV